MGCVYVECANEARCGRFHIKLFYMHVSGVRPACE